MVNAEVDSGNRTAVLSSNHATRVLRRHAGMKCDLRERYKTLFAVCLAGPGIEI